MEFFAILIFIIVINIISGKALYNMPNHGREFYDRINKIDEKKEKY